jgi:hypothetical protein
MPTEQAERFIRRHIRSMSALELLLHLRANADESWTPSRLAQTLRGNTAAMVGMLDDFAGHGLAVKQDGDAFRYAGGDAGNDAALAEIEEMLKTQPFALMEMILNAPSENLKSFSDAFRLRKD